MVHVPSDPRLPDRPGLTAGVTGRAGLFVRVSGVVQGVGFRPFVHRLALRHTLGGWVRNGSGDVQIAVEGAADALAAFLAALEREAPPLARIARVEPHAVPPAGLLEFTVVPSVDEPNRRQPVAPDVGLCAACEAELFDPANRRYRYPFITCTDCGPRASLIAAMPYDRVRTSMGAFTPCPGCAAEYHTPGDRRYHSETNSCAVCGPRLWLEDVAGRVLARDTDAVLRAATTLLQEGAIVALRGIGGFHLAVDARDEIAVQRLRTRKRRDAKPFAVMVRTPADAARLAWMNQAERRELMSPERPVVLLRRRPDARLARTVAPGLATVGVMLAYTPLHHLLLEAVGRPLVMTSGNTSEEPIAVANDDARRRLGGIADALLLHDREILARFDDSVVRVAEDRPILLRRARGYAPLPVGLPTPTPEPLVAVGPHLKNTVAVACGEHAYVSQHVGDLENLETLEQFQTVYQALCRCYHIEPRVAVRDLHPGYLSSRVADELGLDRVIRVQHHHAHVAAVAAEHGVTTPVLGVAFDGTGYGDDGCVWGAEILVADLAGYRRAAQLRYAPLPGGDLAARLPWRAAAGYASLAPEAAPALRLAFEGVRDDERAAARWQLERGVNAPLASSMGRLFDAAAAVLGVRRVSRYEGQAAMELESLAGRRLTDALPFPVRAGGARYELDPLPLLVALGERRLAGRNVADLAAAFHDAVARATAQAVGVMVEESGIRTVVLSGGVFQNARLLATTARTLEAIGLRVLVPRRLGPNDGAISYGQAAVAAALLSAERT